MTCHAAREGTLCAGWDFVVAYILYSTSSQSRRQQAQTAEKSVKYVIRISKTLSFIFIESAPTKHQPMKQYVFAGTNLLHYPTLYHIIVFCRTEYGVQCTVVTYAKDMGSGKPRG
eukprot:6172363-Pleurochrysis_carterae.AAC.1